MSRPPKSILLRSSWQTVNIGDVAHTPGVLALLEKYLPSIEVRLWASDVGNGVEELLLRRFLRLRIVKDGDALQEAFDECDFLLHGSGPFLVAEPDVIRWREQTGKPYGIYGITLPPAPPVLDSDTSTAGIDVLAHTVAVLSGARFAFFRDTVSLGVAKSAGCTCPTMGFAPDGAFATDIRDDARAEAFLRDHDLVDGQFLCCIPRFRYTPYWLLDNHGPFNEERDKRNQAMKEHDHAPLRDAIVQVVRETGLKVLICPEDRTQMAIGREMLYDRLPTDVRPNVVWRPDYWLTAEALSTYVRSAGLFGNEMHSPILCIGNGVPAIVCRWAEQTSKGTMWRDIGLNDWLFDFDDEAEVVRLVPTVLAMALDPDAARKKAAMARAFVNQKQAETMAVLEAALHE